MGRPPKSVTETKSEVEAVDPNFVPGNEVSGGCPWCSYENSDPKKGPTKKRTESAGMFVANNPGKAQCATCGKMWDREVLGQPWSIALERGPQWEAEVHARKILRG